MSIAPLSTEPTALSVARARRLTQRLRESLSLSLQLLTEAFAGRAWEALDYPSWEAYCSAELPELALLGRGLAVAERRQAVATLREHGASTRAIAKPLGLSVGTVHADLRANGDQPATVISLDGRRRPVDASTMKPATRRPKTVLAVDTLSTAGHDGLTWVELGRRHRWHHGVASATLTRLHQQGRVVRTALQREGCAVYVHPEYIAP